MFEFINRRTTIGVRVAMIAACAVPSIALLLYLFVARVSQDIQTTRRELDGTAYLAEIWPAMVSPPSPAQAAPSVAVLRSRYARDLKLDTIGQAWAFAAAGPDTRVATGVALIRAVGDGSGLTLDTELASYYAMDAATVKLPRLLAAATAASRAAGPQERAFAMGQVVNFADATAYDLRQAMAHDPGGRARKALAVPAASLAATAKQFRDQPIGSPALDARLKREIDATWRADLTELIRMLREREARLEGQLALNLALVLISLCLAATLMIATALGVTGRLRGLVGAMARLNAGDTEVDIPYLSDSHETGQIAATLEAFKRGLIHAVEERRRIEAANTALGESEARYRLLADNATDIIMSHSLDGQVVYASPSVRQYGLRPEDMVGRPLAGLVHKDDREEARRMFFDVTQGLPPRRGEWRIQTPEGRWTWLEGGPAPLLDDAGNLLGVLVSMRNVDDRKAAEQALRDVNAELMRVARVSALGAFATSIAHEINQPLAAMITNSDASTRWLTNTPPNVEMAAAAMARAARDARRVSEVVNRMRSLVTRQEHQTAEFPLDDALVEILALTESERLNLGVEAVVQLCEGEPRVDGDRIQIQQVMLNLILNALDAMREVPAGDRRLIVRTSHAENGEIHVAVEDRGCGIDEASAERIFDHLFTTKVGGTGLGLAISKSIVENHGGRIWTEPAQPRGAIFKIALPDVAAQDGAPPA
ncbi:ATP-binding protein [Phenylobacterium aquaticum]|uniref:ATP-binding protein n=1 Tax=Phenylobacterium aquaticum TaxID=1763816 RepID=UPI0026F2A0EA|nr:ATP-binding protein [Phenylobacterium aquaticum]